MYIIASLSYRYHIRYCLESETPLKKSSLFATAIMLAYGWVLLYSGFLATASTIILIVSLIFLFIIFLNKSSRYIAFLAGKEDKDEYLRKYGKMLKSSVSLLIITFTPILYQAIAASLLYILPDTTVIESTSDNAYHVVYGWYGKGKKNLTGSYITNETPDTLFRVNVRYAMFGKDDCNFFSVNDTIPPLSTIKTERKPEYILVRIPSIMNSMSSRRGSYNRVASFIASKRQLENFRHRAMGRFALFPNTLTKAAGLPDRSVTKLNESIYKYENEIIAALAAKGFNPPPSLSKNDRLPFFKHGRDSLNRYIEEHLRYPEFCKVAGIEGKVIVCLSISDKGAITDAKAVGSADPFLDSEAERVAKTLPPWEPGILNGKPTPAKISIPIEFSLPAQ